METIGFGGGCHWCTEGVFQALRGVEQVDQGFIQSAPPWDAPAEGVIVRFDPAIIDLATLTEVHLRTHSGNGTYSPDGRYRSAVYSGTAEQNRDAERAIAQFAEESGVTVQTQVLPLVRFTPSESRYQNYYRTDPARPFCRRYIDPKLAYVRRHFAHVALPQAKPGRD